MEQAKITFIIGSRTYSLRASDGEAVRKIPSADRQQLIALLEAVKLQETLSRKAVQEAVDVAKTVSNAPPNYPGNEAAVDHKIAKPERLGSGDIDALMSRLIMEEKRDKKPGLTTQGLVKWVAGLTAIVVLLVLIF